MCVLEKAMFGEYSRSTSVQRGLMHNAVIPALGRVRPEDLKINVTLGYICRLSPRRKKGVGEGFAGKAWGSE
jgi:hypothetical protein